MSLTCYNLSEDWGWYVDIESMKPVYQINPQVVTTRNKKINQLSNRLEIIKEYEDDEYEYYLDNQKFLDDILIIKNDENITFNCNDNDNQQFISKNLIKFSSTTMLTALITYLIFYIL